MAQWPEIFVKFVDHIVGEVEQFFTEVENATETFTDEVINAFDDFSNHLIANIEQLNQQLEDRLFINFEDYYQDVCQEQELDIIVNNYPEENRESFSYYDPLELNPKIAPNLQHPACVNCANYHGRIYGDNLLVCAIHPYGRDDKNCPDWEGIDNY